MRALFRKVLAMRPPSIFSHLNVMRKAMSLEDNKKIVRRFEEAINKGNVDASGDYIAEDVVELVPFPGQGPGLPGLKDVLKGLGVAFPDMRWTI
jgi:hypothetical protein